MPSSRTLRLRLVLGPDFAIGPGMADLLEGIQATGSIAAAGRGMGMSYRRAWLLVAAINGGFTAPLVEKTKGGATGGKAALTALGRDVLVRYRHIEILALAATKTDLKAIRRFARQAG